MKQEEKFIFTKIAQKAIEESEWFDVYPKLVLKFADDKLNTACKDDYIGSLTIEKGICESISLLLKEDERRYANTVYPESETPSIVIVLESPHKNEYKENDENDENDENNENNIHPALGDTGDNLERGIENLLTKLQNKESLGDGEYNIVLMNSIQYQCSLGVDTSKFRDDVFKKIWNDKKIFVSVDENGRKFNAQDDFCERLKSYKPIVIFNFCTSKFKGDVYTLIQKICEINKDIKIYSGSHPSIWNRKNKRNIYKEKEKEKELFTFELQKKL